jgi:hypothetical protein
MKTFPTNNGLVLALAFISAIANADAADFSARVSASSTTRNAAGPNNASADTGPMGAVQDASSDVKDSLAPRPGRPNSYASNGLANAFASTGPGLIRLHAEAGGATDSTQAPSLGRGSASALGLMRDSFTVLAPGCATCLNGSPGVMTFSLIFDGSLDGGAAYSSTLPPSLGGGGYDFDAGWSTTFGLTSGFGNASGSGASTYSGDVDSVGQIDSGLGLGSHTLTLGFGFGVPISLQWQANVFANASAGSSGHETVFSASAFSLADFLSTFAWGGIHSIQDSHGADVTGFSAFNGFGVDYARSFSAVPEPPSIAIVGLGGLMLLAVGMGRGRRGPPSLYRGTAKLP